MRRIALVVGIVALVACARQQISDDAQQSSSLHSATSSSRTITKPIDVPTLMEDLQNASSSSSIKGVMRGTKRTQSDDGLKELSVEKPTDDQAVTMMTSDHDFDERLTVTKGKVFYGGVRGTRNSSGVSVVATVLHVDAPSADHEYVGWLVRQSPVGVIRACTAEKKFASFVCAANVEGPLDGYDIFLLTDEKKAATAPTTPLAAARIP